MNRSRIAVVAVMALLLVSPLFASAQSTPNSNASLIALLTQLVQILEQELAALESALGQNNPPGSFIASPQSGTAPLSVTFTNVGGSIQFGDGRGQAISDNGTLGTVTHIYASAGAYTATSGGQSATITVVAPSSCTLIECVEGYNPSGPQCSANQTCIPDNPTFTANPISGAAPLNVTFTSNIFGTVDFGDDQTSGMAFKDKYVYQTTHTYTSAGSYTATEVAPCSGVACTGVLLGTVTVTVTAAQTQNISFSANPTSGTAPLSVGFQASPGTNYYINYGDGQSSSLLSNAPTCSSCGPAPATGTHTYQSAGTYTATISQSGLPLCSSCTAPVLGSVTITVTNSAPPVAQPGAHCGGFIANAPVCTTGYFCDANGNPPDTGGICVANSNSGIGSSVQSF